jgi:hypothetical protein
MKTLLAATLALLAAFSAHGQDAQAERLRITAERQAAEARFTEAKAACHARFAVTDCVEKATRDHNATLADLRRQERALNDAERRARAAERLRDLEERNSPQAQQEAAERRARAVQDQKEREAQAAEKARKRAEDQAERAENPRAPKEAKGSSGPQGSARAPEAPKAPAISAAEAARNRAAYEQRMREAEAHKAEVREKLANRTKPAAAPLPTPQ